MDYSEPYEVGGGFVSSSVFSIGADGIVLPRIKAVFTPLSVSNIIGPTLLILVGLLPDAVVTT